MKWLLDCPLRAIALLLTAAVLMTACRSEPIPLEDSVLLMTGWRVDYSGALDEADIPVAAQDGLENSLRMIIRENMPEGESESTGYYFVLLYKNAEMAQSAYDLIAQDQLANGAQVQEFGTDLPDERVTVALATSPSADGTEGLALLQTTIVSCRAVLRYNFVMTIGSPTTIDQIADVQMATAREVREMSCKE